MKFPLALALGAALVAPILPPASAQTPPAARKPVPPRPGAPVRTVLDSGLRLTTVARPDSGLVSFDLRIRVGSGDETAETSGWAHLLEHLLFKGTENRNPGEIDAAAETLGGEIGARTFRDATQLTLTVPVRGWRDALALLSEMALHPALRQEDLDAERPVLRAERALAAADPVRAGIARLAERLFPGKDPYRQPLMGAPESVEKATADGLRGFHAAWYRPERMDLTVVGAVTPEEAAEAAAAFFAGGKAKPVVRAPRPLEALPEARTIDEPGVGGEVRTLVFGWRTGAPDAPELAAMAVLVELLGEGDAGLLGQSLMEGKRPLALALGVSHLVQRVGGILAVSVTAPALRAPDVEGALRAALRRAVDDGVSEANFEAARRAAKGRIAADAATVDGTARRIGFFGGIDAPGLDEAVGKAIDALTPAALQEALARLGVTGPHACVRVGASTPGPSSALLVRAQGAPSSLGEGGEPHAPFAVRGTRTAGRRGSRGTSGGRPFGTAEANP